MMTAHSRELIHYPSSPLATTIIRGVQDLLGSLVEFQCRYHHVRSESCRSAKDNNIPKLGTSETQHRIKPLDIYARQVQQKYRVDGA